MLNESAGDFGKTWNCKIYDQENHALLSLSDEFCPFMKDKTKILIVEDETPVAMMMVHLLMRIGCDVQTAGNAERAMQLAQDGDFDLITLDIDLPGTSGFEICRSLKKLHRSRKTPVVFISARQSKEDQQRAFDLGAVDYVIKPFEATDFIFRIKSHAKAKPRPSDVPDENPDPDAQSLCNTP